MKKEPKVDTTLECRDSVLGLLHETAGLLKKKGEEKMAVTYLEAALNCFCCWEPTYIPKRTSEGKLVWTTSDASHLNKSDTNTATN